MIKLKTNTLSKFMIGNIRIIKIYLGQSVIYLAT